MSVRSIIHLVLLAALFTAECIAWKKFSTNPEGMISLGNPALVLHLIIAGCAAVVGATWIRRARFSSRLTLAVFFFIIAGVLPAAGVLIVATIAWIFASEAGDGLRPEDKYVFGNPSSIAARRESRSKDVELRPLSEAMRSFSTKEIESMIHGLRHLHPSRLALFFLRRFQIDPQSNLQFAAQGVITANYERLESQLKTVTARLADHPNSVESHLAAGEILLELAAWTPEGDATATVYLDDALLHLAAVRKIDPNEARGILLEAKTQLALDNPSKVFRSNVTSDSARLLNLEAAFLAGNFSALPNIASQVEMVPAEYDETVGFWNGSIKAPAGHRNKSATA